MAVQFVLGRSGTGKTRFCTRGIADALQEASEQPLLLLVPEQATYQAERAILSDRRVKGYHRLRILSFDRLQLLLLGRQTARPAISRIGREMLVHKILRETKEKLRIFGPSALLPGFARQMAGMVSELHRYAMQPEDVDDLAGQLQKERANRLAALKFADIALVFHRYSELLEGKFIDPQAQVKAACRTVPQMDFIRGARLWVDGFATFTGGELAILGEVLKAVEHGHIAFCVDPQRVGGLTNPDLAPAAEGLFEPVERTYVDLLRWAAQSKIKLGQPIILDRVHRFEACPSLGHIEENIFCAAAPQSKAGGHIRLVSAPNVRSEIQFVARQILTLVRDKGYRYRDIAVVASDLDRYEQYVRAYFEDYGIPFFIDKRKGLDQHPVVELICSALEAVIGGFDHADVFACLKNDLACADRSQIDLLESYCLAFGVDSRDWLSREPWRFKAADDHDFDEDAVNRIRGRVIAPLLTLRQALCLDGSGPKTLTAPAFTRCVFSLLDDLHVRDRLNEWVQRARARGDLTAADEHRQFFDTLVDVFDELVEVFTHEEMTAQDYFGILNSAFSQMTLAFIPPSLDQVLVGSIERSRHPSLKTAFLVGATQKQFPIPISPTGVLTDDDRSLAEAAEFHLAPPTAQSLVDRQYLAYIAFTRPSESLCVSYPCLDERGGPVARSHFIDDLQLLFDDLEEEFAADELPELAEIHNDVELTELLCTRLGRDVFLPTASDKDQLASLLDAMWADEAYQSIVQPASAALSYSNQASLEDAVARELFGRELRGSATRLAAFAACPYKHFARYTLDLKPRREFKLEPLDLGLFYHRVLDSLHKHLTAEHESFASVSEDRLLQLLREQIARLVEHDPFISNFLGRSSHNAYVIHSAGETLEDCVLDLARMARAGAFRQLLSEVAFGHVPDASSRLGEFKLPLPDGRTLVLNGKIDRLDIAEVDGRRAALIFDYKRTKAATTFSWSQFYHGLNVQLPLYLLALSQAAGAPVDEVAGAFCLPIERLPESASLDELAQKANRLGRKAKGFFNGDYAVSLDPDAGARWSQFYNFAVTSKDGPYGYYGSSGAVKPADFARLLETTRSKIISLATDIITGRIGVRPYRLGTQVACSHCDFKAVCRFDWQINDYNFLRPVSKDDLVKELEQR
jgi:ATP-dependent helicase/nuclease subunit B